MPKKRKAARERLSERLSGGTVWIDLGLRTFGKKVSQRITQEDNQTTDYQFLRLGLSHLTVIYTHMLLDHLLSSVEENNKKEVRSRQSVFFDGDERIGQWPDREEGVSISTTPSSRSSYCPDLANANLPDVKTRHACSTPKKYGSSR